MSMAALAEKAGAIVSKQAISKYEKGQIKPSSEVLLALARALDVKADYFFRSSRVAINSLEFRKKSRLSKKAEEQIKYQTINFLEKYLELEDILNIPPGFDNPVSEKKILSYADIERAAREIREKWKLGEGPVPHLIELLEDKGYKIYEVADFENFDGLSGFVSGMEIPVIAVYRNSDLVRKRFTVAHELAHLLLDFSGVDEKSTEKLCHDFAGALLLPEKVLLEELGKHRNRITEWELKKLKGIFGISMQAIMARAKRLGIISENSYRLFCIYTSKHGWRKKEPGRYEGREVANRFKQLVYHAAAEQIISFSKAAELLNKSVSEFEREVSFVS
ncbi:DNA-binding protein [Desulfolithobacter dissulfuricans]|uniref:DNA-binding protein n=2 Tax=Desulfolithobacter dissulfuricans TaxID=2795293 RepID=A0A915XL80_9BACT|nr:DNA-binding protein [Desulfolithobacter dissulfuricans]